MRILLVSPCGKEDFVEDKRRRASKHSNKKRQTHIPPYALLTVAGLTPDGHDIALHDEHVRGPVDLVLAANRFDLVGISMLTNQQSRTLAIVDACREHGVPVVVGGAGTVHMPATLVKKVDAAFIGEAEVTWPRFIEDFARGQHEHIYRQVSKVDLSVAVPPRWDLIREDTAYYMAGMVQTNRGCPHDCAFCDSIFIYGRRCRMRPIDAVLDEVRALSGMGVKAIMLADDNFTADPKHAKALLRELVKLNNSLENPVGFTAQADIKIADDDEFLELMADCNFLDVLIGVESNRQQALRCLNKRQNLEMDVTQAVLKIQSYGIPVFAMLIAGTDEDDLGVFDSTRQFLEEANVPDHVLWPLMAPTGTALWYQLKRERRLVRLQGEARERLGMITNIVPKKMTRVELLNAMADYWETAFDPDVRAKRVIGFLRSCTRRPDVRKRKRGLFWRNRKALARMAWHVAFRLSRRERRSLFRILRVAKREAPFLLPKVLLLQASAWMGAKRAVRSARAAREQARYEAEHPEDVQLMDTELPIPDRVRDHAREIINTIYGQVQPNITGSEAVYRACLAAFVDFVRIRGAELNGLDDAEYAVLRECGAQALDQVVPTDDAYPPVSPAPCSGAFVREILDGADLELRLGKSGAGITPDITSAAA